MSKMESILEKERSEYNLAFIPVCQKFVLKYGIYTVLKIFCALQT